MAETLKPCRSPYCECTEGKCTHPGFYDARREKAEPTLKELWEKLKDVPELSGSLTKPKQV